MLVWLSLYRVPENIFTLVHLFQLAGHRVQTTQRRQAVWAGSSPPFCFNDTIKCSSPTYFARF